MRPSRFLLLLPVLVFVAGCGSEARLSKAQYEKKVRTAYEHVRQAFRETKVSQARLAGRVAAAQQALRNAAHELDDANPPRQIEEPNHELAEGMREYAEDLDELLTAAKAHNAEAVAAFNARVPENEAIEHIAEAAEEIRNKGYDLGPIAKD
jgi:thiamine biosynthesis lipoprotein ApbE